VTSRRRHETEQALTKSSAWQTDIHDGVRVLGVRLGLIAIEASRIDSTAGSVAQLMWRIKSRVADAEVVLLETRRLAC
jgi:hypothetical protein